MARPPAPGSSSAPGKRGSQAPRRDVAVAASAELAVRRHVARRHRRPRPRAARPVAVAGARAARRAHQQQQLAVVVVVLDDGRRRRRRLGGGDGAGGGRRDAGRARAAVAVRVRGDACQEDRRGVAGHRAARGAAALREPRPPRAPPGGRPRVPGRRRRRRRRRRAGGWRGRRSRRRAGADGDGVPAQGRLRRLPQGARQDHATCSQAGERDTVNYHHIWVPGGFKFNGKFIS